MITTRHSLLLALLATAPAVAQSTPQSASDLFTLTPPKSVFRATGGTTNHHLGMNAPIVDFDGDGSVDVALPTPTGTVVHLWRSHRFEPFPQTQAARSDA